MEMKEGGSFQAGFRNSDGSPRRSKILIDLEALNEKDVYSVNFNESN